MKKIKLVSIMLLFIAASQAQPYYEVNVNFNVMKRNYYGYFSHNLINNEPIKLNGKDTFVSKIAVVNQFAADSLEIKLVYHSESLNITTYILERKKK